MEQPEEAPLLQKYEDTSTQSIQKVLRKVHERLLPFGFLIVCICYMDRGDCTSNLKTMGSSHYGSSP